MQNKSYNNLLINYLNLEYMRWQCRRGMLELDKILGEFLEKHYAALALAEKQQLYNLLQQPDQVILDWLLGLELPSDLALQNIISLIKSKIN